VNVLKNIKIVNLRENYINIYNKKIKKIDISFKLAPTPLLPIESGD
jgi:hypothetical protein